ncbi:MAG: TerB family tellurite resistance protein [Gammaproteobacteria bacterium]
MLKAIQRFFDQRIQEGLARGGGDDGHHALQLATAALLIEMSRADFHVSAEEEQALGIVLEEQFGLTPAESRELLELAALEVRQAASLYQFTDLIDRHFTLEQKRGVLEMLWRVAFADGHKDKYEEYLVRKVADLIHLSHRDFIQTRLKVEVELGKHG